MGNYFNLQNSDIIYTFLVRADSFTYIIIDTIKENAYPCEIVNFLTYRPVGWGGGVPGLCVMSHTEPGEFYPDKKSSSA